MSVHLSVVDTENYVKWLQHSFIFGEKTEQLVEILFKYFPNKNKFDESIPMLKIVGMESFDANEIALIQKTDKFVNRRNKTSEEKSMMKDRTRLLARLQKSIARIRMEMFPSPAEMSDFSFGSEVVLFHSINLHF